MRQALRWWHTHIQRNNNMKDVKVITPEDLGDGIVWNAQTQKYEAISQVFFTEREATVDLMINGMQLLFREVANSNRVMVVTGVNFNNKWYGDAPDNEQATNPFTGQPISAPVPLDNLFLRKTDLDNKTVVINQDDKVESIAGKDTGLVTIPTTTNVADGAWIKLRRIGNVVFMYAGGLKYDLWGMKGTNEVGFFRTYPISTYPSRLRVVNPNMIPEGFRSEASTILSTFEDDTRKPQGSIYIGGVKDSNYIAFEYQGDIPETGWKNLRVPIVSWTTADPFPDN